MITIVCWELNCDGLVSHPGGSKTLNCLTLQKLEIGASSIGHQARKGFSFSLFVCFFCLKQEQSVYQNSNKKFSDHQEQSNH